MVRGRQGHTALQAAQDAVRGSLRGFVYRVRSSSAPGVEEGSAIMQPVPLPGLGPGRLKGRREAGARSGFAEGQSLYRLLMDCQRAMGKGSQRTPRFGPERLNEWRCCF